MNELIDYMIVESENEEGCIKFLNNLHERGLEGKEVELIIVEGGSGTGEGVRPGIFIYRDTEVLGSQVKEFSGGVTEEDTGRMSERIIYALVIYNNKKWKEKPLHEFTQKS